MNVKTLTHRVSVNSPLFTYIHNILSLELKEDLENDLHLRAIIKDLDITVNDARELNSQIYSILENIKIDKFSPKIGSISRMVAIELIAYFH